MARLISDSRRDNIFRAQNGLCYYCHRLMDRFPPKQHTPNSFTVDHLKAKSKGGGKQENLVGACYKCNIKKGNLDHRIFMHNYRLTPLKLSELEAKIRFDFKRSTYYALTSDPKQLYFKTKIVREVPKGSFVHYAYAKPH